MKTRVITNMCIGCGACQALVPEEFEINDDGIAINKNDIVKEANIDLVKEAKENCPTGAISIQE